MLFLRKPACNSATIRSVGDSGSCSRAQLSRGHPLHLLLEDTNAICSLWKIQWGSTRGRSECHQFAPAWHFSSFYTTSRLKVLVWFRICFVTCFSDSCGRGHLTSKTRSWATPWDFEDMFTKQWCRLGLLFLCFSRLDGLEHIGKLLKRSSRLICDNWVLCNRSMATWIFESLQLIWRPSWTSHDQSMMTWANCSRRIV